MEERIAELELRFMDQQHQLSELSDAMFSQQREIDTLRNRVQLLEQKLAGDPGLVDAKVNERPPHY